VPDYHKNQALDSRRKGGSPSWGGSEASKNSTLPWGERIVGLNRLKLHSRNKRQDRVKSIFALDQRSPTTLHDRGAPLGKRPSRKGVNLRETSHLDGKTSALPKGGGEGRKKLRTLAPARRLRSRLRGGNRDCPAISMASKKAGLPKPKTQRSSVGWGPYVQNYFVRIYSRMKTSNEGTGERLSPGKDPEKRSDSKLNHTR